MNVESPPRPFAPRFHTYLQSVEGRRIFVWPRDVWLSLKPHRGEPVLIDVALTPLADVAKDASVVAAAAQETSASEYGISIYRYDPDDPKPYNVDSYSVWEGLPSHHDFDKTVAAASTTADSNLLAFLDGNVLVVRTDKGPGHWLSEDELPSQIRAVIVDVESSGAG